MLMVEVEVHNLSIAELSRFAAWTWKQAKFSGAVMLDILASSLVAPKMVS